MKNGTAKRNPIYIIVWRLIWALPVLILSVGLIFFIGIMYGPRAAKRMRDNIGL